MYLVRYAKPSRMPRVRSNTSRDMLSMRRSIDASSILSNDDLADYDVISDGHRSLESSIADLCHVGKVAADIREPPPLPAAREKFSTAGLSTEDIQAYVQRALGYDAKKYEDGEQRVVRVYVDGVYDPYHAGHALQLRQAKLSLPSVHLLVGVFADELCEQHNSATKTPHIDRCELLRHCRWVDEVVPDAPWSIDEQFLEDRRIDYVVIDEGTSVDPACDKLRLRGYDLVKSLRRAIPTRRTTGLTRVSAVVTRPLILESAKSTVRGAPSSLKGVNVLPFKEVDPDEIVEEPRFDLFGTGDGV